MSTRIERMIAVVLLAAAVAAGTPDADRLASLRRSVQGVDDINEIVNRYSRFVEQATDPAAVAVARRELTDWRDRAAGGWVKAGEKWVSPLQRDALVVRVNNSVEKARDLLKQNKPVDATAMAVDALAFDVDNASAFYLLGVINFHGDQLPAARRQFEFVLHQVPNHGPTLTNLAVIAFRQKQYPQAVKWMDAAIVADPGQRSLIDLAASMLQQLPPEVRPTPVAGQLAKHFVDQDQKLAQVLAGQGLQRVGSRWLTAADMQNLAGVQKQFQDRLDKLATEFDAQVVRVKDLDHQVETADAQVRQVLANSFTYSPFTGLYSYDYPPAYYQLVQDSDRLRQKRSQAIAVLDQIKVKADGEVAARDKLVGPIPLDVIGPDGTPAVPVVFGRRK